MNKGPRKRKSRMSDSQKERLKKRFKRARSGVGLDHVFTFGKYKGVSVKEVAEENPGYLEWCQGSRILQFSEEVWQYVKSREELHRFHEQQRQKRYSWDRRDNWTDQEFRDDFARFVRETVASDMRERFTGYSAKDVMNARREGFRDGMNEGLRRGREEGRRSTMGQERRVIVSPAAQWDNLSPKARAAALLGVSGSVTKTTLREAMKKALMEYHPDKVANAGPLIQELAHQMTVRINEAVDYMKRTYGI